MIRAVRPVVYLTAVVAGLSLVAPRVEAQERADTARFAFMRNTDTITVERVTRSATELSGELVIPPRERERTRYRATLLPDGTAPLLEVSVWRGTDPEGAPARQMTRVIFKEDSVAVDDITSGGLKTLLFHTARGAVPYLNLSVAFLEQAVLRARAGGKSRDAMVQFFGLSNGQTVAGTVASPDPTHARLRLGEVEFQLVLDSRGRILSGTVPAQGLTITRLP